MIELFAFVDQHWRERAACRNTDPSLFFHERGSHDWEQAKRVCWGEPGTVVDGRPQPAVGPCPVRQECLDYAVAAGEPFGTWGGYTEIERKPLRRAWLAEQRRKGRPPVGVGRSTRDVAARRRQEVHRLVANGWAAERIASVVDIDRRTVYRYAAERCSVAGCWCRNRKEETG